MLAFREEMPTARGKRRVLAVLLAAQSFLALAASPTPLDPGLAKASLEINRQLQEAQLLLRDDTLDAYLQSVADRLHLAGPAADLPKPYVRAIKGAVSNAFALPDGSVYVTTEMLIRLRNESQLATVLAHELAHYTERHTQREQKVAGRRNTVSTAITMLVAGLAGVAANSPALTQSLVSGSAEARSMWMTASMSGYSRDLELEADKLGFELLQVAGFDATQSLGVFDVLDEGSAASEAEAKSKFSSHPLISERRASYAALLNARGHALPAEGVEKVDDPAWLARLGDLPRQQLEVKLAERDFTGGAQLAARVSKQWPNDGRVDFLAGEFLRLARQPEAQAIEAYQRSAPISTHRPGSPIPNVNVWCWTQCLGP
jgi:beta-barrel assembly-enhancing protease